jgi:hypothetical protein
MTNTAPAADTIVHSSRLYGPAEVTYAVDGIAGSVAVSRMSPTAEATTVIGGRPAGGAEVLVIPFGLALG